MASKLTTTEETCQGEDCEAITDLTYNVTEEKRLCNVCASKTAKKGCIGKARKVGPNLYCEDHGKDIELYCKTHGVALCYSCASIDHYKKVCVRQDIGKAIMENKAKLNGLKEKAMEKLESFRKYGDQIRQCKRDTDKHLQTVRNEVDSVINEAIKKDEIREEEDAAKINQEVDAENEKLQEEIQKMEEKIEANNMERKERLEVNHTNAEKRREPIINKQRDLYSDIQNIADVTESKIGESEKYWRHDTKSTEDTVQALTTALTDDRSVAKDGHHVTVSATKELKKQFDEDPRGVKHITRTVSDVRFINGVGREKYNGRIGGYDGEWKLIDTINVKGEIEHPVIAGCIDDHEVMITDLVDMLDDNVELGVELPTFVLDTRTKITQRLITTDRSRIMSCVLLNDGKVACGNKLPRHKDRSGDSLHRCISVYDRKWNLINDVTIPRNTTDDDTWFQVAASQDGMIIAAETGQTKIFVINPADGKIINTITGKEDIMMRGVLSTGDIIAQPVHDEVLFINMAGDLQSAHREIHLARGKEFLIVCIDPLTDDIYAYDITHGGVCKMCVIDQVMIGGDVKKRARVASFPYSTRLTKEEDKASHLVDSRAMITPSGKLIAYDGESILLFKKLFRF